MLVPFRVVSEEYLILESRRKGLLLRKLRSLNRSSFFLLADTLASNQPRANLGEQLDPTDSTASSTILSDDSEDLTDAESDAPVPTPTSPPSVTTTPTLTQSSNIDIDDDDGTSSRNLPSYEAKINGNDDVTGTSEVETR